MLLEILLLICSFGLGFCFTLIVAAFILNTLKNIKWKEKHNSDIFRKEIYK